MLASRTSTGMCVCSLAYLARKARPMKRMPTPALAMVLPPNNQVLAMAQGLGGAGMLTSGSISRWRGGAGGSTRGGTGSGTGSDTGSGTGSSAAAWMLASGNGSCTGAALATDSAGLARCAGLSSMRRAMPRVCSASSARCKSLMRCACVWLRISSQAIKAPTAAPKNPLPQAPPNSAPRMITITSKSSPPRLQRPGHSSSALLGHAAL